MKSCNCYLGILSLVLILFVNCKTDSKNGSSSAKSADDIRAAGINVLTKSMEFQCADTIQSGWNTFIYQNQSTEPHFILLDKYPEGKSIKDMENEVLPPFDKGMDLIMQGNNEEAMEAFGQLPEWFSQIVFSGGTGLISANKTAITHVKLKPGYYIMECYVKMPGGRFHTSMGMKKELVVLDTDSGNKAPEADIKLNISSEQGISYSGELTSGRKVFSVTYDDQIVHENFVGHDVSLVKLGKEADLTILESWMNWSVPSGLMSSTLPAGVTFLGGTNDAPAGSILYFEAELEAGEYAFISEVPNTQAKGMLKSFSVR